MTAGFSNHCCRLIYLALLVVAHTATADTDVWAKTSRWTGPFPNLLDSPVQPFESRLMRSPVEYFDSRMMNSPVQLIGSPFGPYRFATLPSVVELWTTRRSVGWLPAMLQTPQGIVLLLPAYALPRSMWLRPALPAVTDPQDAPSFKPRPVPKPKFISVVCGRFLEMTIPESGTLSEKENQC